MDKQTKVIIATLLGATILLGVILLGTLGWKKTWCLSNDPMGLVVPECK